MALPQGEAKAAAVRDMFDTIAPRYDLVNRVMTFRMDVGWRRATVDTLGLAKGATVLDLASGTGDLCVALAQRGYRPVSVDFSFGMLAADHSGAPRVQADALRLRFFGGLKFEEISETMQCSLGTAKNRVKWGLMRLAELVRQADSVKSDGV